MKGKSIHRSSLLVGLIALTAMLSASSAAAKGEDPGRYIVVFKDSVEQPGNLARTQTENRDADLGFIYRHAAKGYSAELTKAEVEGLRKDKRVDFVSRDHELELFAQTTPTGIDRVFAPPNENLDIDEEDDHRVDVDVAVLDTGINPHPDLSIAGRTACVSQEGGVNKCVDDQGFDVADHGTHVAGTIAAIDDGIGVVGVAPGARLWSVQIINTPMEGSLESRALAGVDWVVARSSQIEVVNMSFGCTEGVHSKCAEMPALDGAITEGAEAGIVFVAAAGNNATDTSKTHPASHPDVIAVSALNDADGSPSGGEDELAGFSNYGSTVDVAAPGVDIYSTSPEGTYSFKTGTSMASPHVAGAAALLAAKDKPESVEEIETIRDTIIEEGNLEWIDNSGDGIKEPLLDVGSEAVFTPHVPGLIATAVKDVTIDGAVLFALVNPRGFETDYQFEYGETTAYGSEVPVSPEAIGAGTAPVQIEDELEGLEPGRTYHFRIVAENEEGVSLGDDLTFTTLAPTAATEAASGVAVDEATLNGTINPQGVEASYHFEYGTTTSYGSKQPISSKSVGSGTSDVEVNETITALAPNTTYHFRVVATYSGGTTYGGDMTVTTEPESVTLGFQTDPYGGVGIQAPEKVSQYSGYSTWICQAPSLWITMPEDVAFVESLTTREMEGGACPSNAMDTNECQVSFEVEEVWEPGEEFGGSVQFGGAECEPLKINHFPECTITLDPDDISPGTATYRNLPNGEIEVELYASEIGTDVCGLPESSSSWHIFWTISGLEVVEG